MVIPAPTGGTSLAGWPTGRQARTITAERGGNYVFLESPEKTRQVFDQDFDFLVTPIAHDFSLEVAPAHGVELLGVYGIPGRLPEEQSLSMTAKTVFLSRKQGALTVRLSAVPAGAPLAQPRLGFTPIDGSAQSVDLQALAPQGAPPDFSQASTRKAFALTEMALKARTACEAWHHGSRDGVRQKVGAVAQFLDAEAKALGDPGLAREAELMSKLEQVMGGS